MPGGATECSARSHHGRNGPTHTTHEGHPTHAAPEGKRATTDSKYSNNADCSCLPGGARSHAGTTGSSDSLVVRSRGALGLAETTDTEQRVIELPGTHPHGQEHGRRTRGRHQRVRHATTTAEEGTKHHTHGGGGGDGRCITEIAGHERWSRDDNGLGGRISGEWTIGHGHR